MQTPRLVIIREYNIQRRHKKTYAFYLLAKPIFRIHISSCVVNYNSHPAIYLNFWITRVCINELCFNIENVLIECCICYPCFIFEANLNMCTTWITINLYFLKLKTNFLKKLLLYTGCWYCYIWTRILKRVT